MRYQWLTAQKIGAFFFFAMLITSCSETTSLDGGGTIVPPYPGTWVSELNEEIDFQSAGYDEQYFSTHYEITALVRDSADRCGIAEDGTNSISLEGFVFGDRIELFPVGEDRETACLTGTFSDMITLDATLSDGSTRQYRGVRVQVNLNRDNGIWISDDAGKMRVAFVNPNAVNNNFSTPVQGCILFRDIDINVDVEDTSAVSVVRFTGIMDGYDTALNSQPRIDILENVETGDTVFTDVTFVGPHTLTGFMPNGDPVTLHRAPLLSDSDIFDICSLSDFP